MIIIYTMSRIEKSDGLAFLSTIPSNTVDLVLTDPPYVISRASGMDTHYNKVKENEANGVEYVKTEEEWITYRDSTPLPPRCSSFNNTHKENYMKYGSIYGKKYCVKTDYGSWDSEFTIETLDTFIAEYYRALKKGGTIIIFFDLWKLTILKDLLEKHKFKQIRFIEWIKTNPQPLNSNTNYLTNCREIALLAVKGGKPTFHSKYDNGMYMFPLQGGKNRFHPTQKSLELFETLIKKHSNPGDVVLDTFLGGGTTAIACAKTDRICMGCEISDDYIQQFTKILSEMPVGKLSSNSENSIET